MNVIKGSQMKLKEIPLCLENQFGNHFKSNSFKDITKFLSERNFVICKNLFINFTRCNFQKIIYF